jgi:hypothetical protein
LEQSGTISEIKVLNRTSHLRLKKRVFPTAITQIVRLKVLNQPVRAKVFLGERDA